MSKMFYYCFLRWLTFFFVGLPFQLLTYSLYPLVSIYYWFFVRGKFGEKISPPAVPTWSVDYMVKQGKVDTTRDDYFLNNQDVHASLTHMYLWYLRPELASPGLARLIYPDTGGLYRRWPNDEWVPVSGDALSAWTSSYALFGGDKERLRGLAKHYLARCMGLGAWAFDWKVSSRSSNGGVNFVIDGQERLTNAWYAYLNQPCLGPQYFTSAALFALAAKELGGLWKLWYYAHYWIMGGFMYWAVPFVGPPGNDLYYMRQITVLNAYTLWKNTGNPLYKWSLRYLAIHCAASGNIDPMLYCFAAKAGALSKDEIDAALLAAQSIKRDWPQISPMDPSFYQQGLNQPVFSISAAAAKMLEESK